MINFKKYLKVDILLFLILFFLSFYKYLILPIFLFNFINGWTFNEWLINYQGGFVRRGLIGELIFHLSQVGIDHRFIILFFGSISLFHIIYNIIDLIKDKNIFYRLFVLFNPFGLFYLSQNLGFFFARRDLFYLNFLIYFGKRKRLNYRVFLVFSIFLVLNYGIYIFLIFSIFFHLKDKVGFNFTKFKFSFLTILAPLNILLLTVFSRSKNFEKLCSSINDLNKNLALEEKNCWGAPNWLNPNFNSTAKNLEEISTGFNYYNDFTSWIFIFLTLLACLFLVVDKDIKFAWNQILYLSPYFFFFFFAQDWGRWMFFIFYTLFFISSYSNSVKSQNNFASYIYLAPIVLTIYLNIPTHLFQDILIFDVRSVSIIFYELLDFIVNILDYIFKIIQI
jgi:hypothetical protein